MSANDRYKALCRAYHPEMVGARVKRLRLAWEMSQSGLARHLEVRPNTISQFETSYSRPAVDVAIRIKALFDVPIDWLYFGDTAGMSMALVTKLEDANIHSPAEDRKLSPDARVTPKKLSRPARASPKNKS